MNRGALLLGTALCVAGASFAQAATDKKPVMAVVDFSNSTNAGWWSGGMADDLADMLTNELAGLDKFKMVERKQLGAILGEQDLGAAGRVSKATAAKVGKMTGAQYLVTGTVSAYEEDTKGSGGGVHV